MFSHDNTSHMIRAQHSVQRTLLRADRICKSRTRVKRRHLSLRPVSTANVMFAPAGSNCAAARGRRAYILARRQARCGQVQLHQLQDMLQILWNEPSFEGYAGLQVRMHLTHALNARFQLQRLYATCRGMLFAEIAQENPNLFACSGCRPSRTA